MVISRLLGGLGNQMFQYAAGRALATTHGAEFLVDIRDLIATPQHQGFELLTIFDCPVRLADKAHLRSVLGWQSSPTTQRLFRQPLLAGLRTRHLVIEPYFDYWPGFRKLSPPSYLTGYWQSEHYFHDFADIIRSDFSFRRPLADHNLTLEKRISETNSVSLHIRRGDYVSNPQFFATHGVCSTEYYESAIKYVSDRIPSPRFYVFSDDMEWVRSHLKIRHPCCYVEYNKGTDSYIDMQLMSRCKHNIIANSSFSWWGAWLNGNSDKLVVAPARWFANNTHTPDLLPSAWVTL
ncbi:MAG: alpha-1,2-fucosyltransferase [Rhodocyclaceae bacterium]|nr:alpha-1,2-fucosyltransferase [Rhodocyclaceae bacterium]